MKINILQLKKLLGGSEKFRFTTSAARLAVDEPIWIDGSVEVNGEIVNNGRFLQATGLIAVSATVRCDRCLEEFSCAMEIPFREDFLDSAETDGSDGETADVCYYRGDELDISRLVRDCIILAEPIQKVCREDCQGLCPVCGVNRNHTRCSCEQTGIDPRLAALKAWLDKPPE